jgi:two-component system chemotaxis sensor kinase CheA
VKEPSLDPASPAHRALLKRTFSLAFRSIQLKMFGVVCALTLALVAFLTTYFPARHVAAASFAIQRKAETYARLIGRQVESAIAFDDRETAREIFEATATDRDVLSMGLYTADGQPLYVLGEPTKVARATRTTDGSPRIEKLPGVLRTTVLIVSKEGPRGTLVFDLSTASIAVERDLVQRAAVLAALPALALGLVAAWLLARSIGSRVHAVARVAAAVAGGDLTRPRLTDTSADEVGQLARSFNEMMAEIERLLAQISTSAAEEQSRLGHLIALRTAEVEARNGDMRLVFDHVGEGFLTIDREGKMSTEKSAILARWFGHAGDDLPFWEYLGGSDPEVALSLQLGFEAILDDVLPLELALDQMPQKIFRAGLSYRIRYTPVFRGDAVDKLLLVVSDVSHEVARARADEEARDMLTIFERARRDRSGLAAFVTDTDARIQHILAVEVGDDLGRIAREIHTVKGTSGMFGFPRLTQLCHDLEGQMAETGEVPSVTERARLETLWDWITSTIDAMVGDSPHKNHEITAEDLAQLRELVIDGRPRAEMLDLLTSLDFEPAARGLERLAELAVSLAARLDKPRPVVSVEGNGVRLDPERWAPFWSALVHLVRNAIDHGIEAPVERVRAGKRAAGRLFLRTSHQRAHVMIEIADDGGGIDWDAIAVRASAAGLPADTPQALESALFHDGLSTKDSVTEYSGRGVGLGAVREACAALGGTMDLVTTPGHGTIWRFRVPASIAERAYPAIISLAPQSSERLASA